MSLLPFPGAMRSSAMSPALRGGEPREHTRLGGEAARSGAMQSREVGALTPPPTPRTAPLTPLGGGPRCRWTVTSVAIAIVDRQSSRARGDGGVGAADLGGVTPP